MADRDELAELRVENARLIALLEAHGIEWRQPVEPMESRRAVESSRLSTDEKVALFRRLFRGRTNVYPVRWESKTTGKSGYAPACANEWRAGVCEKPRIKCGDCGNRLLIPLSDAVVYDHLAGEHTIGVYPLLEDDACYFLAVDFDEAEWRDDARAFVLSCHELGVPVALEISRSGQGAHAWIFFSFKVSARDARRLGTAIISHTCSRTRQLKLSSYDRLFPNQDAMPKGGFGNLIALPLQKRSRETGCSVFVDTDLRPYTDQWAHLASIEPMAPPDIEPTILRATGNSHPLDVTFIDDEDLATPWKRNDSSTKKLTGKLPESLTVTVSDQVYFEKAQLPQSLANRLIRLAAFQNPEFYRAQAMRMSVWDKPRVIGCAENYPLHIALPRGCFDAAAHLLADNGIRCDLNDERSDGAPIDVNFIGELRLDQEAAVSAMLHHDTGVLCAPTAFGKTVTAAAMIARRGVNTLVLVHRNELLKQWHERLQAFLGVGKGVVGTIGGGKAKPTGVIDIAVMQSVSRQGEVNPLVENYGHVIVDECHHVGAVSFDAILKRTKAKFVLGLTATPIRRDGQQPIIFMQCGPIRYTADKPASAPHDLEVVPHSSSAPIQLPADAGIQEVFRHLANDRARTDAIAAEVSAAVERGRKVLVLTERTEHVDAILRALEGVEPAPFVLHGRMSKKQRATLIAELNTLPPDASRILLATGRLVGEGFDHPPLDTLVLAMPVSWKGTLQQYAGRLHREHASKTDVRIIDFVDTGHPALLRMWDKRQRGYRAMGYRINDRE
ncbi:TOTE conflict system archaeo-eukaryotic primase domain-containing protein [Burkholderia sp. LA-2-3-30-S1-D2]|uniref:TOTE conflict system archaeo-eukaryotic primase domain-containing protein n=1 Tax=Burkholderia sp. LA-2-3-30-S1-D2 TaxID=1637862 RepID=UPI00075CCFB3|nr:DEAD/DEAH box helicase family protein [Burkholderia sp. LA-2-3-30-S1-D2]AOI96872.1 DEAD/DEAH box helicase [Burkholderia sp. LA-2-3-30-S1-D2]KVE18621.1 DEAD/DEAH box helicase [Burkholderia sp. LA-2-3-30-S1-D2]